MALLHSAYVVLAVVAASAAQGAEFVPPAACPADLAAVDDSFQETQERLHKAAVADHAEKCAAIRHHVEVMANGINVFQRCMEDGHDKGENIAQLGASIADFLDISDAEGCERFPLPKLDLPQ